MARRQQTPDVGTEEHSATLAQRIGLTEFRNRLTWVVRQVISGERFVISDHKDFVIAVVSPDDLRALETLEDRVDLLEAREALEESDERTPYAEVRKELGLE